MLATSCLTLHLLLAPGQLEIPKIRIVVFFGRPGAGVTFIKRH